jgi:hypothetical protein
LAVNPDYASDIANKIANGYFGAECKLPGDTSSLLAAMKDMSENLAPSQAMCAAALNR